MSEIQTPAPQNKVVEQPINLKNKNNVIFAVILVAYEILTLPIFGSLYELNILNDAVYDYGGILLVSITTILLIIGMGLINTYIAKSAFSGMTFTLVIFALTVQHFMLFRAFWYKAGTSDIQNSTKSFSESYDLVTLSNIGNDRQTTTMLPSGPFVEGIACALSMAVAFNSVVGRIGLLETFVMTFLGTFFYEVNAQLHWRWYITDNSFNYRIILFGSILGIAIAVFLDKRETTVRHQSYQSVYKVMALALFGFLFMFVSLPILSAVSMFTRTDADNAALYATSINAWLAVFSGVLGTFTSNAIFYRKFSIHDLVFTGLSGAFALSSEFDVGFNPCAPLIVGFIVGFLSSTHAATLGRKLNEKGVLFSYPHLNRFLIPGILGAIVSAIVQACDNSINGDHIANRLSSRSPVSQGGWQILGILITAGIALLAGLIIGIIIKLINNNRSEDQFNDETIYEEIPSQVSYV